MWHHLRYNHVLVLIAELRPWDVLAVLDIAGRLTIETLTGQPQALVRVEIVGHHCLGHMRQIAR